MKIEKIFRIPGQWTISSYYTLMPLAPDNSGRLTLAACDLKTQVCSVFILDEDGKILDQGTHSQLLEKCESYRKLYQAEATVV